MDHLYQIRGVGQEDEPMLEGWSVLAALARETTRVRLGTLVTGVTYRNPAMLAKQATTLDTISGGRAVLGLGAAWNEAEHAGYGYDFPPIGERMDRLDEALTIVRGDVRRGPPDRSTARYYRIERALNVPRPVQPGGPPILVGGGGEQRTLRIAAKHADMTHWFPLGLMCWPTRPRSSRATARRSAATRRRSSGRWRRRWSSRAPRPRRRPRWSCSRRSAGRTWRGHARPGRRRPAALHRRRLHGLHVQQHDLQDAGQIEAVGELLERANR